MHDRRPATRELEAEIIEGQNFRGANSIKAEVHVARIGGDVAECSAFAAGKLKHDYLRVDRVEDFLGF
jgi:hypothetical protein